ncbi:MAG: ABC transporter permease [Oscillospiraceae bacterium]|nr:ABC transporter permease [Oscillospiraceae bacterium]
MKNLDIIGMGIKNLIKRKTRTILTILGVLIGTAAIIVMISLGIGTREANEKAVESEWSVNLINVSSYYYPVEEDGSQSRQGPSQGMLDDKAIAEIAAFPEVEAASPQMYEYYSIVSGKYKVGGSIIGLNVDIIDKLDLNLAQGRLLEEGDTNVVIFGARMPYNFYNTRSNTQNWYSYGNTDFNEPPPVDVFNDRMVMTSDWSYGERRQPGMGETGGQKPKLHNIKAIGLLEGAEDVYSQYDYSVIVNIDWLKKIKAEDSRRVAAGSGGGGGVYAVSSSGRAMMSGSGSQYDQAIVRVRDKRDVEAVQKRINEMGLGANSSLEWLNYMQESTDRIQMLLGAIAAVSLLVAAINIANTMIMSVYERTKEIAIMKVLGCKLSNIGQIFLFEAGMIGFFGGAIGIGFSYLVSYVLNRFGGNLMQGLGAIQMPGGEEYPVSVIPVWLVLLGLAFATVIGVVSGFLPARRAMKLSVLQAIHN